ncbi:MAG: FxDxF family PEP-CTERM protein [Thiomicrorhabdus sp.]|nr:FxDxF family PEP-CTERM protein [Thiomicrorhabdus sp.]
MKMINKMGLAASLVLASSLASANAYNLHDITNSTTDFDVPSSAEGFFTDTFQFSLSGSSLGHTFAALATSSVTSISNFLDIELVGGTSGTVYDIAGVFSVAEYTEASTGGSINLSDGSYVLSISGIAGVNSTGYTVNTVTSPVPEPSSIALMLGGLGLVGFMAARRSKKA